MSTYLSRSVLRMSNGGMFVEERKQRILERIESRRKATVAELCEQFHVSSATIRSDLRDLEAAGLLIRTHGGAMVQRGTQHLAEKRTIGERALALVEDGDTVILDTGTTTLELARLLGRRRDLIVVTNDLAIAQAETKKLMMSIAAGVILQYDAGKLGSTSFACFALLETIDTIVTDATGDEDRTRLEENGIDVLVAG